MAENDFVLSGEMSWGTFTMMPHDEQEKLLKYVTERYRVGTSAIANDLFHVSQHTLYRFIRQQNLDYPKHQGGRVPDALMSDWKEWIVSLSAKDAPAGNAVSQITKASDETVDSTANSVGDVVRTMHALYGKIRVTISIEPV